MTLGYAPTAAAANASSIVVSPSTAIVSGSAIVVSGTGFPPNELVGVVQCVGDATNETGCDLSNLRLINSDSSGAISGSLTTRNPMLINGSRIDCNEDPRGCMVGAAATLDIQGTFATAPITFAPATAPLAGTSKLANNPIVIGMTTAVDGSGWSPYAYIDFELCQGDGTDISKCVGNDTEYLDASGTIAYWLYIPETIYYDDNSTFTCSVAPNACSLVTFDQRDRAGTMSVELLDYEQPRNGTLTVTPTTPINDGDPFTVVGTNWQPNTYVFINLCASTAFCVSQTDSVVADAAGNFTLDLSFPQWIDSQHACDTYGVVCSLVWAHELLYGTEDNSTVVHYSTLPTPTPGSISAPSSAVELTYPAIDISGWAPRSYVEAALCEAHNPNGAVINCTYPTTVQIDSTGAATFTLAAEAAIAASGTDCSIAGACHIAVWDGRDQSIVATRPLQVLHRPIGSFTVTPNTALHDGDHVTVAGSGWAPDSYFSIRECLTAATNECEEQHHFVLTDAVGDFTTQLQIADTVPDPFGWWYTDCTTAAATCSLVLIDYSADRQAAMLPINFGANTTDITSSYTAPEAAALHSAALQLGLSDAEFQHVATWATMYVLGLAGATSVTPVVNTGPSSFTTSYPAVEYRYVHGGATKYGRTDGEFQKLSAIALAFVLGFS